MKRLKMSALFSQAMFRVIVVLIAVLKGQILLSPKPCDFNGHQ
jgi:hypothetical protein